jgi:hypothetical protein
MARRAMPSARAWRCPVTRSWQALRFTTSGVVSQQVAGGAPHTTVKPNTTVWPSITAMRHSASIWREGASASQRREAPAADRHDILGRAQRASRRDAQLRLALNWTRRQPGENRGASLPHEEAAFRDLHADGQGHRHGWTVNLGLRSPIYDREPGSARRTISLSGRLPEVTRARGDSISAGSLPVTPVGAHVLGVDGDLQEPA